LIEAVTSLAALAGRFDLLVFDQWGVLHDGTRAYPGAREAVRLLAKGGTRMAVLSNSGKRSGPNAERIAGMGFAADSFSLVMTSGEALWRDMSQGRIEGISALYPVAAKLDDARSWMTGIMNTRVSNIRLVPDIEQADGVLLMGLADDAMLDQQPLQEIFAKALARNLPVLCSNPDKASPRAGGVVVASPGSLAHAYSELGGRVLSYGKPYLAVFRAVEHAMSITDPSRILMIGDSPEHDIAGAKAAGWGALLVRGGLHARFFNTAGDLEKQVRELCHGHNAPLPDYMMEHITA
jgi:HAD superfamily hydrolase (TIGR01459 family)